MIFFQKLQNDHGGNNKHWIAFLKPGPAKILIRNVLRENKSGPIGSDLYRVPRSDWSVG